MQACMIILQREDSLMYNDDAIICIPTLFLAAVNGHSPLAVSFQTPKRLRISRAHFPASGNALVSYALRIFECMS